MSPCPRASSPRGAAHIPWFNGTWDPKRDARNRLLSSVECELAFPGLFADIDRIVAAKKAHPITQTEMDEIQTGVGAMKAMIYDQQVGFMSWWM